MNPGIVAVVKDLLNVKTGWKTSEFWVALVPALAYVLNLLGVSISNGATTHLIVIVSGAVSAVYIAGRSVVKTAHVGHAANLSAVLHQVEQQALSVADKYVGPPGPPGPAGDKGEPGAPGDKGEKGEPGQSADVNKLKEALGVFATPVAAAPKVEEPTSTQPQGV